VKEPNHSWIKALDGVHVTYARHGCLESKGEYVKRPRGLQQDSVLDVEVERVIRIGAAVCDDDRGVKEITGQ